MTHNSTVTPDELRDLLSSSVNNCTEADGEQKAPTEGSVREVVTPMEGEAKEAEAPIDGDVAEVNSSECGEVREVSESAEGKLQKVEASTKDEMKLYLDDSELPTTIDGLNKFIANSKKKQAELEEKRLLAIQCECIKILALSSNVLAITGQQTVRVSKDETIFSFVINSKEVAKSFEYTPKSVITLKAIRHTLESVKGLRENKNDPGADYIDLEFTKDAKKNTNLNSLETAKSSSGMHLVTNSFYK